LKDIFREKLYTSTFIKMYLYFRLIMRNISDQVAGKLKRNKQIMCSIVYRKSCRLWDNVEKYTAARKAADDNIIRRMRSACWINKARM